MRRTTITIPQDYAYVLAVATSTGFLLLGQQFTGQSNLSSTRSALPLEMKEMNNDIDHVALQPERSERPLESPTPSSTPPRYVLDTSNYPGTASCGRCRFRLQLFFIDCWSS